VDHVQSGQTAHFLNLEDLLVIIHRFGVMVNPAGQPDRREERASADWDVCR
jgi:hypothetical protein